MPSAGVRGHQLGSVTHSLRICLAVLETRPVYPVLAQAEDSTPDAHLDGSIDKLQVEGGPLRALGSIVLFPVVGLVRQVDEQTVHPALLATVNTACINTEINIMRSED